MQEELGREKKKTYIPSTRDRQNRHRFIRSFRPARKTKDRWRWLQRQVFVHKLVATCTSHQHYWSMVRIFSACRNCKQFCSEMWWSTLGEMTGCLLKSLCWRLKIGVNSIVGLIFCIWKPFLYLRHWNSSPCGFYCCINRIMSYIGSKLGSNTGSHTGQIGQARHYSDWYFRCVNKRPLWPEARQPFCL